MCLSMTPPPPKKRRGFNRKVVFGTRTVPVSCSGQAALVLEIRLHKSLARVSLRHLWSSSQSMGRSLSAHNQWQSTCGCGLRAMHRQCGRWEDLEGLCPLVALPCKGRQERNTWPVF